MVLQIGYGSYGGPTECTLNPEMCWLEEDGTVAPKFLHPAILRVNRQTNLEASAVWYSGQQILLMNIHIFQEPTSGSFLKSGRCSCVQPSQDSSRLSRLFASPSFTVLICEFRSGHGSVPWGYHMFAKPFDGHRETKQEHLEA